MQHVRMCCSLRAGARPFFKGMITLASKQTRLPPPTQRIGTVGFQVQYNTQTR